jgi:hypothetical protein
VFTEQFGVIVLPYCLGGVASLSVDRENKYSKPGYRACAGAFVALFGRFSTFTRLADEPVCSERFFSCLHCSPQIKHVSSPALSIISATDRSFLV